MAEGDNGLGEWRVKRHSAFSHLVIREIKRANSLEDIREGQRGNGNCMYQDIHTHSQTLGIITQQSVYSGCTL